MRESEGGGARPPGFIWPPLGARRREKLLATVFPRNGMCDCDGGGGGGGEGGGEADRPTFLHLLGGGNDQSRFVKITHYPRKGNAL